MKDEKKLDYIGYKYSILKESSSGIAKFPNLVHRPYPHNKWLYGFITVVQPTPGLNLPLLIWDTISDKETLDNIHF